MVSGMILSLALGIASIIAVGWLARQTQAGEGIAELGEGISSFLSPQITPTFKPMVEIGIGPNIGGLISWLQDSWGAVSGGSGSLPAGSLPSGGTITAFTKGVGGVWGPVNSVVASPRRMLGIDGSRL